MYVACPEFLQKKSKNCCICLSFTAKGALHNHLYITECFSFKKCVSCSSKLLKKRLADINFSLTLVGIKF